MPERSTTIAGLAGAITTLIFFALETWGNTSPIPPAIAAAATTVIMAIITHLVPDAKPTAPPPANAKPAE